MNRLKFLLIILFFHLQIFFISQKSFAQYCTTGLYNNGCLYDDYIDDITIGIIAQTNTGCSGGATGFADYTSFVTTFEQGNSYSLSITCGFDDEYINIWIDYDDDFIFESNEQVLTNFYCANKNNSYATTFSISSSANIGSHRMRVRDVYNTVNAQACALYSYGEVHDYTAKIIAAATNMSYVKSEATQADTSNIALGATNALIMGIETITAGSVNPFSVSSFTLNSTGTTDFANDVSGVKIYSTGSSNIYNTNLLFGSAANLSLPITGSITLLPDTNFFWVVYDLNSSALIGDVFDAQCTKIVMSGAGGTKIPSITSPSGNRTIDYCEPLYGNDCSEDYINGVSLNTLSNLNSGCNGNTNNYTTYTPAGNLTTTLVTGNNYNITLSSGIDNEGFGVWIDFNNDGDFADENEFVYASPYAGIDTFIGNIYVPAIASYAGERRMRVRCAYYSVFAQNDYCNEFGYGETEDYTITIALPPCSGTPDAGIIIAEPISFCEPGTIVQLHLTEIELASGLTYQWQQSNDALVWGAIPGATDTIYVSGPLFDSIYYRVKVTCANGGATSTTDFIHIILFPKPVVSFTGLDSTYHVNNATAILTGNPAGGIFSGTGISGNTFDPATAGVGGPYEIVYTYTDSNGCSASDTQYVTVLAPDYINEINSEESISVYPNPTAGKFIVDLNFITPKNNFTISILNLLGMKIYAQKYSATSNEKLEIDLSEFPKGNYLIQFNTENIAARKLLIVE